MVSSFDANMMTSVLGVKVICIVLLLRRYFTLVVNIRKTGLANFVQVQRELLQFTAI
jgi:hypothetical protein